MDSRHQQRLKTAFKRAAFWLLRLLLLLAAPQLRAQSADEPAAYVLSERVGAALDAEERAYFGFFPRLDGFESARIHAPNDTTIAFAVARQGRPDTTIMASREAAEALGRYVDHYERLFGFNDARRLERWGLVVPFARLDKPYREGYDLTVTTRDDEQISGRLLYVNEEVVVLSQADGPISRLTQADEARVLLPHEVKHIRLRAPISFRLLNAANIPFAGSDSIYAAYTLPTLSKRTTFRSVLSPEIRSAVEKKRAEPESSMDPIPFDLAYLQSLAKKLHASFVYPVAAFAGEPPNPEAESSPTSVVTPEEVLSPQLELALGVDYTLTKRMWLGGRLQQLGRAPFPTLDTRNTLAYARTRGYALGPVISYVFNPANALDFLYGRRRFLLRRVEVRAGVGPSYARFSTEVAWGLSVSAPGPSGARERYIFSERVPGSQHALGATSLLSADFYLVKAFSLSLAAHASWFPSVRVEEQEVAYTGEAQNGLHPQHPKRLEGGAYRLSFASASFGVRLHL